MPELEIELRCLEGNWREVRMVYEVSPDSRVAAPVHVRGDEAKTDIVLFILAFAEGIATSTGQTVMARAIGGFSNWIHEKLGCTCQHTRH